jgi:hypothetical protein
MNNKKYYIGTRADWSKMNEALNQSVSRLNERLSQDLRTIALEKGIKKTEQGNKLLFYSVSSSQLSSLMTNNQVRPLIKVDDEVMTKNLSKVNSSFPGRMNTNEFSEYKKQLKEAMRDCVEVIGADTNERAKPTKVVGKNPYKVGDWIDISKEKLYYWSGSRKAIDKLEREVFGHSVLISDSVRVCRVTDKSYWIEVPILKEQPNGVSNWRWAQDRFDNVIIAKGCDSVYQHNYDWTIPYEGNEEDFEFIKAKTPIRITKYDIQRQKLTKYKGYRAEYTQRD